MEFKSLLEHMNDALTATQSPFQSIEEFISDGDHSQDFIDHLMTQNTVQHFPAKLSRVYRYTQDRARHIAVTFLVGMVFSKFCGFYDSLPGVLNFTDSDKEKRDALAQRMWLITSLSHDNGYRLKDALKDEKLDLEKMYPNYLLTDEYDGPLQCLTNFSADYPQVCAHNYDQIRRYNNYVQKYHTEWKSFDEANDHGILGGVEKFHDLVNKMDTSDSESAAKELALLKTCCLTVAQHNIFKSRGGKYDDYYKQLHLHHLLSNAGFRITGDTPLLLFLCLVDTIECMKRFSKGATGGKYLEALTILEKIRLHVDEERIVLDYTQLKKHIDDRMKEGTAKSTESQENKDDTTNGPNKIKTLAEIYAGYRSGLTTFDTWTVFKGEADPTSPDIITITMSK